MAIHKKWRQTYFSTPSSLTHSAYPFWSGALFNRGRNKADKVDIDLSQAPGLLCADGQYRQIVTVEDAVRGGCNLFDLDQLRMEYSPRHQNLLMCEFVDDLASVFPLSEWQACMVDSWEVLGPTFMHWHCAHLAGAKCGSVMTRRKVRRTATVPDAWWWHRQPCRAASSAFLSVTSGAGWTFAPRLTPSKN
ncbi:terminase large subunit domain-containing protein [Escherichia coli]